MESPWSLNGDHMETCWRQIGNKTGDKPWRQQWNQMQTLWSQNVNFYEVNLTQNGVDMETKMETTWRQNVDKIETKLRPK